MVKNQTKASMHDGFTLIELMVVIVIAAILLSIAVPSFQSVIKRNNVDSLQSKLSSAISTARTEAASRNKVITICPINAAQTDCSTNWSAGWIVFENTDNDAEVDAGETVIDVHTNSTAYSVTASPANEVISFNSQGFTTGVAQTFFLKICEPDNNSIYARGLYVNASGLVMKTRDTNDNGIHNSPTTTVDLTCP